MTHPIVPHNDKQSVGTHEPDGTPHAQNVDPPQMFAPAPKTLSNDSALGTAQGAPANASVLGGAKAAPSSSGGDQLAKQSGGK